MKPETTFNYYSEKDYPVGGNHPDYPDLYRVTVASRHKVYEDQPYSCVECPMRSGGFATCDRSCGFGRVWVDAVTWIRIRMMENQE